MPKLDLDAIPQTKATGYPAPYDAEVQGRWYRSSPAVQSSEKAYARRVPLDENEIDGTPTTSAPAGRGTSGLCTAIRRLRSHIHTSPSAPAVAMPRHAVRA